MKPTPDEPSEDEQPSTRMSFATFLDEGAGANPVGPEATLAEGPPPSHPDDDSLLSKFGGGETGGDEVPGPTVPTKWSSGSEVSQGSGPVSHRGIVGKIEPGQTLYSKYQVLRRLGAGAMGEVWLVRHVVLKSHHALKVIIPNFATNAVALMRFQREFEVMATLRHEHAVIIYDANIDADGGYIDMEYVEGQTIHELLGMARGREGADPSGPLVPLDWIVRILDQLSDVLEVAHQKGIVHRDLKPSNMMLLGGRPPGKEYLKVLDFGIAKIRDDPEGVAGRDQEEGEHRTQGFIGTPSYGSPEQALGSEVDGRADLYSVGIMLYEFITGRLPFRGNQWQVMSQNATSPPPSFAETNPQLRPMPEVEHVILRILAKDPKQRPQTARKLYEEVRRAVEAVLPAGSANLPPPTWAAPSPAHVPYSPLIGNQPSTHHDSAAEEPPGTEVATLVGKPHVPSWKRRNPTETQIDVGLPRSIWSPWSSKIVATTMVVALACALLLWLLIPSGNPSRPEPAARGPAIANKSDTAGRSKDLGSTVAPKWVDDFERYWDKEYRPVEGSPRGIRWPEKVRRASDQAVFDRFGDGIYLPETFEPDSSAGLADDGWPKVIVKDGIRFLRLRGGAWVMGAWDQPRGVDRPDVPAHPVKLTGFYIQETEVTNGQFEDFLRRVDASFPKDWERTFNTLKRRVGPDDARKYPASNLSRERALDFAREIGGQLPTEAQWEYAARSLGERRHYVWGDAPAPDRNLARIDALDSTPAAVASYPKGQGEPGKDRTVQGVYDLTGNVQEMCRDAWVSSYVLTEDAVLDPCAIPTDPASARYSIRGGAYNSLAQDCATTRRDSVAAADLFENLGFRLVVECPDARAPR